MLTLLHRWQIVVLALVGWINRQQLEVIEYLKEENRVLRESIPISVPYRAAAP